MALVPQGSMFLELATPAVRVAPRREGRVMDGGSIGSYYCVRPPCLSLALSPQIQCSSLREADHLKPAIRVSKELKGRVLTRLLISS